MPRFKNVLNNDVYLTVSEILTDFVLMHRLSILGLIAALIIAAGADVLSPYLFSSAGAQLTSGQTPWLLTLLYIMLVVTSSLIGRATTFFGFALSETLTFFVSTRYFERLTLKRIEFFANTNAAEIQDAFSRARDAIRFFVQFVVSGIIPGLLRVFFGVVMLGSVLTAELAAVVVFYGCFTVWLTYYVNRKIRPHLSSGVQLSQEIAAFTGNAIHAMEILRYFRATNWMRKRFDLRATLILNEWRDFSFKQMRYALIMAAGLFVQLLLTFALVVPGVHSKEFSVWDIVLFNMLIFQLNAPFEMVGRLIDDGVRSYENLTPFSKIWRSSEESEDSHCAAFKLNEGTIVFDDLTFIHPSGRGVTNVNFATKRGAINFIVGPSGSGKSTLFRLALKAIEPQQGRIVADGIDLSTVSRDSWYGEIAIVPQDAILLNDTLVNNIILGREYESELLQQVIKAASLSELVGRMEGGLDTVVGERGISLSGGERQRIAIARALYVRPKVLFLDEASSALDEITEEQILSDLRKLAGEVTIIAITHRLKTVTSHDLKLQLSSG